MASPVGRKACYKCGNVGHYAENCRSAERLCYNCHKPGHESVGCDLPRTSETKQCYHCHAVGHVQADCPAARIIPFSSRCYTCNGIGHNARQCVGPARPAASGMFAAVPVGVSGPGPVPMPVPVPVSNGGRMAGPTGPAGFQPMSVPAGRPQTCYKCGGPNHFARDCQAQAAKCYACGRLGHISRTCQSISGGIGGGIGQKTCYRCSQIGHISARCPLNFESGPVSGPGVAVGAIPASAMV